MAVVGSPAYFADASGQSRAGSDAHNCLKLRLLDGKPAAPGLLETPIATGDVGECKGDNKEGQAK
jgi:hypothetical protein